MSYLAILTKMQASSLKYKDLISKSLNPHLNHTQYIRDLPKQHKQSI